MLVRPAVLQHECTDLLAMHALGLDCSGTRPDQISHGFVPRIGDPYRRQFSSSQQLGKTDSIAPVGLDPVARAASESAMVRRHRMDGPMGSYQPMKPVASRAGLVAEMGLLMLRGDPLHHSPHALRGRHRIHPGISLRPA